MNFELSSVFIDFRYSEKDPNASDDSKLEQLLIEALSESRLQPSNSFPTRPLTKQNQKFIVDEKYKGPIVPTTMTVETIVDMISYFKVRIRISFYSNQ